MSQIVGGQGYSNGDMRLNDSIFSLVEELGGSRERKRDGKTAQQGQELLKLYQEVNLLKKTNLDLEQRVSELSRIQDFLIERETFICQITEKNIELTEQCHLLRSEKEQLLNELITHRQKSDQQIATLQIELQDIKKQCSAHRKEIKFLTDINSELNKKLQDLSGTTIEPPTSQEQPPLIEKERVLFRVRSDNNIILGMLDKKEKGSQEKLKGQVSVQLEEPEPVSPKLCRYHSLDEQMMMGSMREKSDQVSELRQQLKYKEIQNDILKRMKLDFDTQKFANYRLKRQNMQLRTKNQHFMRQSNNAPRQRKRQESFEYSLSPPKKQSPPRPRRS